jgi:hypothetical protein
MVKRPAIPLLYNYIFLVGLMNYIFGIGVALWGFGRVGICPRERLANTLCVIHDFCRRALFLPSLSAGYLRHWRALI